MNNDPIKEMENDVLDKIETCIKCRMCVNMCPTYEGWLTQSTVGRLLAMNFHFRYGLGSEKELSRLLYECTTCRRCQERCRMLSRNVSPTDIILKGREILVRKSNIEKKKGS
jgi:Fe-S oxidoreductase